MATKSVSLDEQTTSRDRAITAIRRALKARSGKDWSVTGGRGTSWGWIRISVPPKQLGCDQACRWDKNYCTDCGRDLYANTWRSDVGPQDECLKHVCTDRCYRAYMTPSQRAELAALLGKEKVHAQGESIPSSSAYYREYVSRAAGLDPAVCGTPYWD